MTARYAVEVQGIVQGVGFRPFVFRLAEELRLTGWVYNSAAGVSLEIEGEEEACRDLIRRLYDEAPLLARVDRVEAKPIPPQGGLAFVIRPSRLGEKNTLVSPDMGICPDCLAELRDPANRRYRYAFTNCTNCGPRFTIIESLPYDRPFTTMRDFPLCGDCAAEYHDPRDRRFHAQPNACPACGPRLSFRDREGGSPAGDPLALTQQWLKAGRIMAIKGLGGYHLACDARNGAAVSELRRRKYRWDKPFALMAPDLETARRFCQISGAEAALLTSQRRPIVLLNKGPGSLELAGDIAPGNGRLGMMLPYTPLHDLLLEGFDALVMTSGNLSEEPIAYDDQEAFLKLRLIADGFLTHDRAIFRRCDDSVMVHAAGLPRLVRRSRGYAPEPLFIPDSGRNILATGGSQKNTFCLTRGNQAFLSQHIGDLLNLPTFKGYCREIDYFRQMFSSEPQILAYDPHPEYLSTKYAVAYEGDVIKAPVQHHHAHLASVLAEHRLDEPVVGLIFDGTGYGADGRLWGGEVLVGDLTSYWRAAHLLCLPLPGGEQAIREPWRQALSALRLAAGRDALERAAPPGLLAEGWRLVLQATEQGLNAPFSSGMGRLFDAAAALIGIGRRVNYEGQAAVELEQVIDDSAAGAYRIDVIPDSEAGGASRLLDWRPLIISLAGDLRRGTPPGALAVRFHRAVVNVCLEICERLREETGLNRVALSGGCWQNVWLLEHAWAALEQAGFRVYGNSQVPANDGGIAYGQAAVAAALARKGEI